MCAMMLKLRMFFIGEANFRVRSCNAIVWDYEPKTPQANRPEAYLWRMLEMSVW
jgi:hypothetical protein